MPPTPAYPPVHAVHWKLRVGENKVRFLDAWLPHTDPWPAISMDNHTFEKYEERGAHHLGSSQSARFNTMFDGYSVAVTKWGLDKETNRFFFWSDRGHKFTGLFDHRTDKSERQSLREILGLLRPVKKSTELFEIPSNYHLPHPLPGEPPVPPRPSPCLSFEGGFINLIGAALLKLQREIYPERFT